MTFDEENRADINIWHSDHLWRQKPTSVELLLADVCPATGGDLIFVSQSAAYETLSEPVQAMLQGLTCVQNLASGYQNLKWGSRSFREAMARSPPVEQPVVGRHPVTGNPFLTINESYCERISQLTAIESDAMIRMLCQHSTRPDFMMRHKFAPGDLVIWDNLATQHFACSDYYPERRVIHRASVEGDQIRCIASVDSDVHSDDVECLGGQSNTSETEATEVTLKARL